jgi:hypothetical protein
LKLAGLWCHSSVLMPFLDFIEAHNGAITSLATIVVAVFTIVLALVTRRQAHLTKELAISTELAAKAARDSASALPRLERAYLFVETDQDSLASLSHAIRQAKVHTFATTPVSVSYELVNQGKTPALLKAQRFTMQYRADTDSPAVVPLEPISAGEIVIRGGEVHPKTDFRHSLRNELADPLSPEEVERLGSGLNKLLFIGRFIYDDVFGNVHETSVCWRYDPTSGALVEFGGAEWNRRT